MSKLYYEPAMDRTRPATDGYGLFGRWLGDVLFHYPKQRARGQGCRVQKRSDSSPRTSGGRSPVDRDHAEVTVGQYALTR